MEKISWRYFKIYMPEPEVLVYILALFLSLTVCCVYIEWRNIYTRKKRVSTKKSSLML